MDVLFAYFIYPGLLPTLIGTVLVSVFVLQRNLVLPTDWRKAVLNIDGFAAIISIVLSISACMYMPWPSNSVYTSIAGPLLMWAALEIAFLLPPLAAQTASSPMIVRGAVRSLQIGLAGRVVIWCVFSALSWANQSWQLLSLPAVLLAWGAAILALPAAIGIGMFRNNTALTGMMTTGLNISTVALLRIASDIRSAVLIFAVTSSLVPPSVQSTPIRMFLIAVCTIITMLAMRILIANQPFATLSAALRWCWWRALPPALLALLYLSYVVA